MQRLKKQQTLQQLPAEWPESLLPHIRQSIAAGGRKLVVLDDDPTGTQTVYDIPVLTEWSVDVLAAELTNELPAFYILTNSRSLPLVDAQALNHEIGQNLLAAGQRAGRAFAVVSRSDSTLRGHYPGEVDALAAALGQDVDATLIIPFFLEGGRLTINDVHYVAEGDELVPAAETPFAKDAAFGYTASNLRDWVFEKTGGRVQPAQIYAVTLEQIRTGGPQAVAQQLTSLPKGSVCIINSVSLRDQEVFVAGLLAAEAAGKQFIFRTAASFVQARLGLATRPILTQPQLDMPKQGGGLVVVGSYVPKTSSQLERLLAQGGAAAVEINVNALLDDATRDLVLQKAAQAITEGLAANQDVVVYTSRQLISAATAAESLAIGQRVSDGLVALVQGLTVQPRYLLAKGGITSSDVATKGLGVKRALVLGQILPGVPVWRIGAESRFPGMPYIVFPGNVGDEDAVANVVKALRMQSAGE
ncbi:MAG: four-carbon acid sugar kinase family protein [Caldilineaceae bacterium]